MDALIYIVLIIGAVIGFMQGAFKQTANAAGVLAGLVLAIILYEKFGDGLSLRVGVHADYAHVIAFVLIVIVVPVVLGFVASLLTKLFAAINLGWLNRLAGAAVGVVVYGLFMSVAFNIMDFAVSSGGTNTEKLEKRTPLYYKVKQLSHFIVPDILIVTDLTEEASGQQPHHGLADKHLFTY